MQHRQRPIGAIGNEGGDYKSYGRRHSRPQGPRPNGSNWVGAMWRSLYPDSYNLDNDQESIQLSPETAVP